MKKILLALNLVVSLALHAQQVVPIYKGVAPGSENWTQKEVKFVVKTPVAPDTVFENVVTPKLAIFQPESGKANGTAVVICPGGGFRGLGWNRGGTDMAKWFAERGTTAFVLKYRTMPLPDDSTERAKAANALMVRMMQEKDFDHAIRYLDEHRKRAVADGQQAIRYIRERAAQWGIQQNKIGIMGFSAGAALAVGVVRSHDEASKPNFVIALYGYDADYTSPMPADTPPAFIAATQSDRLVPVEQSTLIFSEWTKAKAAAEFHVFEKGPHGFALTPLNLPVDNWTVPFEQWLKARGLISSNSR